MKERDTRAEVHDHGDSYLKISGDPSFSHAYSWKVMTRFCSGRETVSRGYMNDVYIITAVAKVPHGTKELDGVSLDNGPTFAALDIGNDATPGDVEVVGEKARQVQLDWDRC